MAKPMTHRDLLLDWGRRIRGTSPTTNRLAEYYEALLDVIYHELAMNGKIRLRGIGVLYTKERGGKDIWNPSKQIYEFAPKKLVPAIKFGKPLKEFLASDVLSRRYESKMPTQAKEADKEAAQRKEYEIRWLLQQRKTTGAEFKEILDAYKIDVKNSRSK